MTNEEYEQIASINGELSALEDLLKTMKGCSPSSGMSIEVKTGYSDMGHDITRTIKMKDDIALDCFCAIRNVIEGKLEVVQKKFDSIKVDI